MLSVLVPCKNEAENLPFLLDEIAKSLKDRSYEIIIIDDGSTDNILDILRTQTDKNKHIRCIRHDKSAGKGAALRTGASAARGEIILTIDGDGQNDPVYLPQLADALASAGAEYGIACGQRRQRKDSKAKQYASRFANALRQKLLQDNTRDTACGLKAVYTHIFRRLPFFENWQRYFPALVKREGYKAVHIDVIDRPRRFGISKYGIFDRGFAGISDLAAVCWLMRRSKILPKAEELTLSAAAEETGTENKPIEKPVIEKDTAETGITVKANADKASITAKVKTAPKGKAIKTSRSKTVKRTAAQKGETAAKTKSKAPKVLKSAKQAKKTRDESAAL